MPDGAGTLTLPVETTKREFDSRLLLGALAATAGYRVILGSDAGAMALTERQGPTHVVHRSGLASHASQIAALVERGHSCSLLDEEGLLYRSEQEWAWRRLSRDNLDRFTFVFAWGNRTRSAIHDAYGEVPAEVRVTGSPRVDLWRPEFAPLHADAAARLRQRYGRYVLLAFNFQHVNHPDGREAILRLAEAAGWFEGDTETARARFEAICAHKAQTMDAFADAIPRLAAALPDLTFVLRPHPREGHAYWNRVAEHRGNIVVDAAGSITPWVQGAHAVVHHDCTTGVEAAIAGTPAISFSPFFETGLDYPLPTSVSHLTKDQDGLVDALRDPHAATPTVDLVDHVGPLDGALAAERIIEAIGERWAPTSIDVERLGAGTRADLARTRAIALARATLRRAPLSSFGLAHTRILRPRKTEYVGIVAVRRRLRALAGVRPALGRVRVSMVGPFRYVLHT